jgi:predicted TIM-barrel fold metal-dependent hydrolase
MVEGTKASVGLPSDLIALRARGETPPVPRARIHARVSAAAVFSPGQREVVMSAKSKWSFRGCACCLPSIAEPSGPRLNRRNFLAGVASLAAAASIGAPAVRAQTTPPRRIDVHHHMIPQFHAEALLKPGRREGSSFPKWSPALSIEEMDKSGIATSILSQAQPGVWFGDNVEESRKLSRDLNEYGAKLVRDHAGRFGLFAVIAPPDTEGSLKEIEYAFDTLKVDGVGLLTSYGTKYLGDPSFAPVYEELNRRKAVVYVHPTTPGCCRGLVPGIPVGSIEYATDSTRTIAHLVFSGTATKFPDIRWIFSHSGGTLPFLTGRFIRLAHERKPAHLPNGPMPEFGKFFYELAQGNTPGQIAALLKMVAISQVMYGTDYPFRDGAEVNAGIAAYGFSAADVSAIERDNALKLLPRLKAA